MKVTRIAYSRGLNRGKYVPLAEQARRPGRVRSMVWRQFGTVAGVGLSDRVIRDAWMVDGTAAEFGLLANAWKETVRDAASDNKANREAAKAKVRKVVWRYISDRHEQRRLYTSLKSDTRGGDPYLSRLMRRHWKRGRNRTTNQIVVRSDQYRVYTLVEAGDVWIAVPGLERRKMTSIPLNTTVAPEGTLRSIPRDGRVEVHYAVDAPDLRQSRPCGTAKVGVDKGYTAVLTDFHGQRFGHRLGEMLTAESDHRKVTNARRAKLRSIAEQAREAGDFRKANRITTDNLGCVKRDRRQQRCEAAVRTITFTAVHAGVDKACQVVAEDLTRLFTTRKKMGKNVNRRLAAWTKGVTAEALHNVSERRGSALTLVNAAYTSQVVPCCRTFGNRMGDRLDCIQCGAVWHADHAAAINVLERDGDPDISLFTPHTRVKQLIQERVDRHRTKLLVQDSSAQVRRAKNPLRAKPLMNQEAECLAWPKSR